ncbi:hypothetical protein LGZ99_17315 [Photorhabdus temperata]|uniref:Uncharacterized protein n=1 Tax=Photorhabdus temperata subsp. temperata Meg1 TaxID=1393735 RepID=A0A081RVY9_PHOTE|nr:hypothetical protein [Photorhabdus temperata]KER02842.1 hypothetical protein MEG1DRAFT_02571 [Photorhabdus temperata subsp. temperata Meg1]MCT8348897.1 hypothetical protein [Photorhabdus temperata]
MSNQYKTANYITRVVADGMAQINCGLSIKHVKESYLRHQLVISVKCYDVDACYDVFNRLDACREKEEFLKVAKEIFSTQRKIIDTYPAKIHLKEMYDKINNRYM